MNALILALLLLAGIIGYISYRQKNAGGNQNLPAGPSYDQIAYGGGANNVQDALAEARHWVERLGGQVLSVTGTDSASSQAMADASERYNAANSALSTATTVRQAELAREAALEGLYYVKAAREIMGLPAGPGLPPLAGQREAGAIKQQQTIQVGGQQVTASPVMTPYAQNYYPGGMVAGRPVPAGWYSTPWWADALRTGLWAAGSMLVFDAIFDGISGLAHGFGDVMDGGFDLGGDFFDL